MTGTAGGTGGIDDLAPRVKTTIVLGYLSTVAVVTLLPLTWGSRTALDHIFAVAPVAAIAWFGTSALAAKTLARRWPRTATTAPPVTPPIDEDDAKALSSMAASVRRWSRWRSVRWLAVIPGVAIAWAVTSSTLRDAEIAAHEPRTTVPVVAVDRSIPTRSDLPVSVTVELRGERVDLWGDLPDAEVGDAVTVVVDPAQPDHVMDVATHTCGVYSPPAAVALGVAFGAIPVGLALLFHQRRGAERALATARNVEIVEFEQTSKGMLRVRTSRGDFRWVQTAWPDDVRTGHCRAVGEPVAGGWLALICDGTVEWPDEPLEAWDDDYA